MTAINQLSQQISRHFGDVVDELIIAHDELTLEIAPAALKSVCRALRDDAPFRFDMLMDVAGVDYLDYGCTQWRTEETTATGYDRGVDFEQPTRVIPWNKPRFASVYHLLSTEHNHRLRVRVFVPEQTMMIDSVISIWASANWYEREAFDLFGIIYEGHPDLRRILTDYGFVGHPFRKDFPLSGHVEVRYDAKAERVIYEPVDIEPRVLVPKVIRDDSRYLDDKVEQPEKLAETKQEEAVKRG
ncbi:MAG: NADH-quinone oxidoreductase subunit C [Pseudomonadota bacterium]